MERKEIIDRINALNHEQLEMLLALMQDEERNAGAFDMMDAVEKGAKGNEL